MPIHSLFGRNHHLTPNPRLHSSTIVPAFVGVVIVLTIAPCVAALYHLGDDISFFSFYSD